MSVHLLVYYISVSTTKYVSVVYVYVFRHRIQVVYATLGRRSLPKGARISQGSAN
jgi:hypothetical protein